jgi:hypothetical protein
MTPETLRSLGISLTVVAVGGAITAATFAAKDKVVIPPLIWAALATLGGLSVLVIVLGDRGIEREKAVAEKKAGEKEDLARADRVHEVALKENAERDHAAVDRLEVARQVEERARNEAAARAQEATDFGLYLDDAMKFCAAFRDVLPEPGGGWIGKAIEFPRRAPFIQPAARFHRDHLRVAAIVEDVEREARTLCESRSVPSKWASICNKHDDGRIRGDAAWCHYAERKAAEVAEVCREVRMTHGLASRLPIGPSPPPSAAA